MKTLRTLIRSPRNAVAILALLLAPGISQADTLSPLIDDFTDATHNSLGIERRLITDTVAGGGTTAQLHVDSGQLSATGDIVPPRGQPGWASLVILLHPQGQATDASAFEGILLRVKVKEGNLSVSANSTEITNFDYHVAPISVSTHSEFQEVKIPFASMKRSWSEQTPLNPTTLGSLGIIAYGVQKTHFDFELSEVRFY